MWNIPDLISEKWDFHQGTEEVQLETCDGSSEIGWNPLETWKLLVPLMPLVFQAPNNTIRIAIFTFNSWLIKIHHLENLIFHIFQSIFHQSFDCLSASISNQTTVSVLDSVHDVINLEVIDKRLDGLKHKVNVVDGVTLFNCELDFWRTAWILFK